MSNTVKIEIADVWIEINELHDNVAKRNITPAEALVIRKQFGVKIQGQAAPTNPITHLVITGAKETTQAEDFARLTRVYGDAVITKVFPGENPNIPLTFASVGFEETKESEPAKGEPTKVIPLAQLPKEEVTDEQSVKELEQRKQENNDLRLALQQQGAQIAQLTGLVTALVGKLAPGVQPLVAPAAEIKPGSSDSADVTAHL